MNSSTQSIEPTFHLFNFLLLHNWFREVQTALLMEGGQPAPTLWVSNDHYQSYKNSISATLSSIQSATKKIIEELYSKTKYTG